MLSAEHDQDNDSFYSNYGYIFWSQGKDLPGNAGLFPVKVEGGYTWRLNEDDCWQDGKAIFSTAGEAMADGEEQWRKELAEYPSLLAKDKFYFDDLVQSI
uniref:Uncharacterized protein n=1 Tax=Cyanothece sp. (strain PCC 7425 / ATCC 29141) TaxID=395961 RepID=B8HYH7_CYAP4